MYQGGRVWDVSLYSTCMISFQKTIPYYYYYLVYESKKWCRENHRFFKFLKCITSYYRYCNLQRNSEALKAKKDTHTYAHIHEHTPHEEHWHTYAHIHEHTLTWITLAYLCTYTRAQTTWRTFASLLFFLACHCRLCSWGWGSEAAAHLQPPLCSPNSVSIRNFVPVKQVNWVPESRSFYLKRRSAFTLLGADYVSDCFTLSSLRR